MSSPRLLQAYQIPQHQRKSGAALVNGIRHAVHAWRNSGYDGATNTTKALLRHWFETDHTVGEEDWLYYYCQREAIETIIYLREVLRADSLYKLAGEFDHEQRVRLNPAQDRWPRYVCKMATGSGKTKVMSLAIVWSYFNARREPERRDDYTQTFALIAPNVIVYQRLLDDFRDGAIFRRDPLIPKPWQADWSLSVVTRDDPFTSTTPGTLYLTNIHQLFESRGARRRSVEPAAISAVLGGPPPGRNEGAGLALRREIASRGELMVLNDEAHHIHTDELEWSRTIDSLDRELKERGGAGLRLQLDFSATPKHTNGRLFDEIVVDYPIAQAVEDGIVKRPILGELSGDREYPADNAADRHRDKLNAGIRKWREVRDALKEVNRNPLLFVMTEDTTAADEIAEWLATLPEFSTESVLNIHTNLKGQISEATSNLKELERLREAARRVDEPDNPYRAIVSVLMLREGWDVRNVCVIVPLRQYSAKSQILPEQTMGRGLRRMWSVAHGDDREQLIVIEHEAFHEFWERELGEEGLDIAWEPVDKLKYGLEAVRVDPDKLEYDIEIPQLTPGLHTRVPRWDDLSVAEPSGDQSAVPLRFDEDTIHFTARDWLTLEIVGEEEFERDFPADTVRYLNHVARMVLRECRLANLSDSFAQLAPRMRAYIEQVMFSERVSMDDELVMARLNHGDAKRWLFEVFIAALRELSYEQRTVEFEDAWLRVSDADPFVTSRRTLQARKTIFSLVPCDSGLEHRFAQWLDTSATDVIAFAKNEAAVHFDVPYVSANGGLRHYRPDFFVRTNAAMFVIETKGFETAEVPRKDKRIAKWCHDATALTGTQWRYLKVTEELFDSTSWDSLASLVRGVGMSRRA